MVTDSFLISAGCFAFRAGRLGESVFEGGRMDVEIAPQRRTGWGKPVSKHSIHGYALRMDSFTYPWLYYASVL